MCTATTGLPFPRPIPWRDHLEQTWKDLANPLELEPPMSVADPPTIGRSGPLHCWTRYIRSHASLVDTIDWKQFLTFILHGDA